MSWKPQASPPLATADTLHEDLCRRQCLDRNGPLGRAILVALLDAEQAAAERCRRAVQRVLLGQVPLATLDRLHRELNDAAAC
jgi:hypothetical protein